MLRAVGTVPKYAGLIQQQTKHAGIKVANILIAATPEDKVGIVAIMNDRHGVIAVSSIQEVLTKLETETFDLIMVGVHFDDSRMFEVLPLIRKAKTNFDKPIICFCMRDTPLTRTMHESINIASKALGAWMYIDHHKLSVSKNPDAEILRIIERCITDEERKKTQTERVVLQNQRKELLRLRQLLDHQEWTLVLEDEVSDLREKLSKVLLELSELQIDSMGQREKISESRLNADRVSKRVELKEMAIRVEENQIGRQESEQLAKEQAIIPKEEEKGKEGRRKLSDKT